MNRLLIYSWYQMSSAKMVKTHSPSQSIFSTSGNSALCDLSLLDQSRVSNDCALIVNYKLNLKWLQKGLLCSRNIVLADGGANQLFQTPYHDHKNIRMIVGDLDSLKPQIRQYYENKNVMVKQIRGQDTNDFQKGIQASLSSGWKKICCFGAFGGRLDHSIGTMHFTTKLCLKNPELQILLFGQENFMYFLKPNISYTIKLSNQMKKQGCGVISFGRAQMVKTKGFRWNLGPGFLHESLEWGKFQSTSNEVMGDTVEIESNAPLFFVGQIA